MKELKGKRDCTIRVHDRDDSLADAKVALLDGTAQKPSSVFEPE